MSKIVVPRRLNQATQPMITRNEDYGDIDDNEICFFSYSSYGYVRMHERGQVWE